MDRLKEDGFDLLKKQVNLPSGPIKTFKDDYIITVNLHSDISVTIPIELIKNTQTTKDIVPDLTNEMDDVKDTEQVSDTQPD